MSALVDRAGVSLRTVYNYFEAKDSLVDALQAETLTRMDEQGIVYVDTLDHMPETIRPEPADFWLTRNSGRSIGTRRSGSGGR